MSRPRIDQCATSTYSQLLSLRNTSTDIDDFFTVDDIVRPGQTISSSSFTRRAGGKGANQAVAVSRAGGKALLSGSVGLDGAWLVQSLKEAGVDIGQVIEVAEVRTFTMPLAAPSPILSSSLRRPLDVLLYKLAHRERIALVRCPFPHSWIGH